MNAPPNLKATLADGRTMLAIRAQGAQHDVLARVFLEPEQADQLALELTACAALAKAREARDTARSPTADDEVPL